MTSTTTSTDPVVLRFATFGVLAIAAAVAVVLAFVIDGAPLTLAFPQFVVSAAIAAVAWRHPRAALGIGIGIGLLYWAYAVTQSLGGGGSWSESADSVIASRDPFYATGAAATLALVVLGLARLVRALIRRPRAA